MIWIYGASGHGKVILDILECQGKAVGGFIDDDESINRFMGYPVIHKRELVSPNATVIMGIGNNAIREKVVGNHDFTYVNAIHPKAVFSKFANMGEGIVVMAGAIVQAGTTLGNHVIINTGATIDHDCQIGDFVHVSPGSTLCGNVTVGKGSWIGAGTTIIQGVTIGSNVIVGAGSVIRKNVPDNVMIVGNPPEIKKRFKP